MFIFTWLVDLIKEICSGVNSIVEIMAYFAEQIKEATTAMSTSTLTSGARTPEIAVILDCCTSLKYVIGSFLYNTIITMLLFGCCFATYKFLKQLTHILFGNNGLIGKTGITSYITNLFKK